MKKRYSVFASMICIFIMCSSVSVSAQKPPSPTNQAKEVYGIQLRTMCECGKPMKLIDRIRLDQTTTCIKDEDWSTGDVDYLYRYIYECMYCGDLDEYENFGCTH